MKFGMPHRHFRLTDSTNARLRELAERGAPGGTVITAAEQSEGRGRQGRSWTAPPDGALLYSALLRPLGRRPLLPLAAALAVCEAAEAIAPGIECRVKWPNDVQLGGRKLAGILIEARPQAGWAVIGVGLNLSIARLEFPLELRQTAVSLLEPREGRRESPLSAALTLSGRLDHWVDAPAETVLGAWRSRDALAGCQISWQEGSGLAAGIDHRGNLLVTLPDGGRAVLGAGEVHLIL